MELKPSNRDILEQLKHGSARFELVSSPPNFSSSLLVTCFGHTQRKSPLFFANLSMNTGPWEDANVTNKDRSFSTKSLPSQHHVVDRVTLDRSISLKRSLSLGAVKQYDVDKVAEDGRSLFRAVAKGIAFNEGGTLDEDQLQRRVKHVLCNDPKEKVNHSEAISAIKAKDSLENYCQRFGKENILGGRPELLVLSKLYEQPIKVYLYEDEHALGVIPIAEYGAEFRGGWRKGKKKRNVVRLLYNVENNHYDLLR